MNRNAKSPIATLLPKVKVFRPDGHPSPSIYHVCQRIVADRKAQNDLRLPW